MLFTEILFVELYTPHSLLHTLRFYVTLLFSAEKKEDEELPVDEPKPESEEHVMQDNQEAMQGNGDLILLYFITNIITEIECNADKHSFVEHPKELTEEEKHQIVHSEEFLIFFDHSIRVVERTLAEDLDIFFDYSGRDMENKDGWGHFSLEKDLIVCTEYDTHSLFFKISAPHVEETICRFKL